MESIKEIYKIGYGPSSSHTMGPAKAARSFKKKYPMASRFVVTLFGSLAATGKGHMTDHAIEQELKPLDVEFIWEPKKFLARHPNAVKFVAFNEGESLGEWTAYSVGGGRVIDDETEIEVEDIYPKTHMKEVLQYVQDNGMSFWEYVEMIEDKETLHSHLEKVWKTMKESIKRGIENEGTLPGILKLPRKAASYHVKAMNQKAMRKETSLIFAFALAVSEENAAAGEVVTAPTCGSCGILPAVLLSLQKRFKLSDAKIVRALETAGLVGNFVKENASISGAEVGCQGEVGTAAAMAAAAATQLMGGTPAQIEYAAEMGLEHHLGLTCDPIAGLVQIPCIERNAHAAIKAYSAATFAIMSDGMHYVPFDSVVEAMKQTGDDLPHLYKETSEGGLARFAKRK